MKRFVNELCSQCLTSSRYCLFDTFESGEDSFWVSVLVDLVEMGRFVIVIESFLLFERPSGIVDNETDDCVLNRDCNCEPEPEAKDTLFL